jgi:hypothetical protein
MKIVQQIKVFNNNKSSDLELDVNKFLKDLETDKKISIKYSTSDNYESRYSCCIIYKKEIE